MSDLSSYINAIEHHAANLALWERLILYNELLYRTRQERRERGLDHNSLVAAAAAERRQERERAKEQNAPKRREMSAWRAAMRKCERMAAQPNMSSVFLPPSPPWPDLMTAADRSWYGQHKQAYDAARTDPLFRA